MPQPPKIFGVGGIIFFGCDRPCVSLCVPKTSRTPYLKNQWSEFHPILVTGVLWFVTVMIKYFGSNGHNGHRSRLQQTVTRKSVWIQYIRNNWNQFHQN